MLPFDFAADGLGFALGFVFETDLFEFTECRTRLFRGFAGAARVGEAAVASAMGEEGGGMLMMR